MKKLAQPLLDGHSTHRTRDEMALTFDDPSLLRGAAADVLLKNRSEIFSSNVLSAKDVADLHKTTAVVTQLDDFISHSWATGRFDKWATLLLYLNAPAAAVALVVSALCWASLELLGVVPTPLLTTMVGGSQESGMPMLVGYIFGGLVLFYWQRLRQLAGRPFRRCFLDKVCIDQVDDARKSAGIASLGAFLGSSANFVVLYSPEYFTRLWCCFELAAFHQVQDPQKQRVIFFPVAFPRVLFANLLAVSISTFPDALLAWYGPMLGIDIDHVDEDKNAEPAWMGYPGMALFALTMYECQRCVAAREKIEEQMASFSIAKAECFDERDRPRIEQVIAQWFGGGDRAAGIKHFDSYVRENIKQAMEELVGKHSTFGANIPWSMCFLSGAAAILEDISGLTRTPFIPMMSWQARAMSFMAFSSCVLVGTPMLPVVFMWLSTKRFRFAGGWPMILLAPFIGSWVWTLLIVDGSMVTDFTACVVWYCLILAVGAWAWRESLIETAARVRKLVSAA